MKRLATAAAVFAVIGTAASAQVSTTLADRPEGPIGNSNQIVCVREAITGSRLAQQRVCRTRAEWAEYRAQARNTVDRVQMYKPSCTPACGTDPRGN